MNKKITFILLSSILCTPTVHCMDTVTEGVEKAVELVIKPAVVEKAIELVAKPAIVEKTVELVTKPAGNLISRHPYLAGAASFAGGSVLTAGTKKASKGLPVAKAIGTTIKRNPVKTALVGTAATALVGEELYTGGTAFHLMTAISKGAWHIITHPKDSASSLWKGMEFLFDNKLGATVKEFANSHTTALSLSAAAATIGTATYLLGKHQGSKNITPSALADQQQDDLSVTGIRAKIAILEAQVAPIDDRLSKTPATRLARLKNKTGTQTAADYNESTRLHKQITVLQTQLASL